MLDGKSNEVSEGTWSCHNRNLVNFHRHCQHKWLCTLPSTCDEEELIQRTLFKLLKEYTIPYRLETKTYQTLFYLAPKHISKLWAFHCAIT